MFIYSIYSILYTHEYIYMAYGYGLPTRVVIFDLTKSFTQIYKCRV